jgi:hypothetical protein
VDWRILTGVLSGVVGAVGLVPYILATARRTIRPSALTWTGQALLAGIVFVAQITAEPSWSAVIAGVGVVGSAIVAVLAVRVNLRVTLLDIACAALGLLAIIAWQITQDPRIALGIAIGATLVISVPMLVKTFHDPGSEPLGVFAIWIGGSSLAVISASRLDFLSIGWPAFFTVFDVTMALLVVRGRAVNLGRPHSASQAVRDARTGAGARSMDALDRTTPASQPVDA